MSTFLHCLHDDIVLYNILPYITFDLHNWIHYCLIRTKSVSKLFSLLFGTRDTLEAQQNRRIFFVWKSVKIDGLVVQHLMSSSNNCRIISYCIQLCFRHALFMELLNDGFEKCKDFCVLEPPRFADFSQQTQNTDKRFHPFLFVHLRHLKCTQISPFVLIHFVLPSLFHLLKSFRTKLPLYGVEIVYNVFFKPSTLHQKDVKLYQEMFFVLFQIMEKFGNQLQKMHFELIEEQRKNCYFCSSHPSAESLSPDSIDTSSNNNTYLYKWSLLKLLSEKFTQHSNKFSYFRLILPFIPPHLEPTKQKLDFQIIKSLLFHRVTDLCLQETNIIDTLSTKHTGSKIFHDTVLSSQHSDTILLSLNVKGMLYNCSYHQLEQYLLIHSHQIRKLILRECKLSFEMVNWILSNAALNKFFANLQHFCINSNMFEDYSFLQYIPNIPSLKVFGFDLWTQIVESNIIKNSNISKWFCKILDSSSLNELILVCFMLSSHDTLKILHSMKKSSNQNSVSKLVLSISKSVANHFAEFMSHFQTIEQLEILTNYPLSFHENYTLFPSSNQLSKLYLYTIGYLNDEFNLFFMNMMLQFCYSLKEIRLNAAYALKIFDSNTIASLENLEKIALDYTSSYILNQYSNLDLIETLVTFCGSEAHPKLQRPNQKLQEIEIILFEPPTTTTYTQFLNWEIEARHECERRGIRFVVTYSISCYQTRELVRNYHYNTSVLQFEEEEESEEEDL